MLFETTHYWYSRTDIALLFLFHMVSFSNPIVWVNNLVQANYHTKYWLMKQRSQSKILFICLKQKLAKVFNKICIIEYP